jgi:hypothetical protein
MEQTAQLLEESLLVIWNDRNAESRLEGMKKTYAPDIVFYENNEGPAFIGYEAINALVDKLQGSWPLEFKFELTAPAKVNHQVQHIAWKLGIPGQKPVATGMDVAIIEDHRIKSLHLLLG